MFKGGYRAGGIFLTIFVGGIIIATVGGSGGGRMDNNSIEWASV